MPWSCPQEEEEKMFLKMIPKAGVVVELSEVRAVLAANPSLIDARRRGRNALHLAETVEVVALLLSKREELIEEAEDNGDLPIHTACRIGILDVADFMLDERPDLLFARGNNGQTPLLSAAEGNALEVMQYLAERQDDVLDASDDEGNSAIHLVASLPAAKWYLRERRHALSYTNKQGQTPILLACTKGKLRLAQWYYNTEPHSIQHSDSEGQTALHLAALGGRVDVVQWVHEVRPQLLTLKNKQGETPLLVACRSLKLPVIRAFYDIQEQTLDDVDVHKRTALHCVVATSIENAFYEKYALNLAIWIVGERPDFLSMTDEYGMTPLELAEANHLVKVTDFLRDCNPVDTSVDESEDDLPSLSYEHGHDDHHGPFVRRAQKADQDSDEDFDEQPKKQI